MESLMTVFFAKAYGIYFITVGVALFLNPQRFRNWYNDILTKDRRALFGGVIALLIGCFIIAAHNIWVMNWPVLITLIGYWGAIKGAGLLISPRFVHLFDKMVDASDKVYQVSGIVWVVIGLFLAYQGFMVG